MPDLSQLRELTGQVRSPDLHDLAVLAQRRRRRSAAALATGVTAGVALAVAVAAGVSGERQVDSDPVAPSPDPSPSRTFAPLTAEEIRNHPDAGALGGGDFPATASSTRVRVWTVCLDDCRDREWRPGEQQQAVEVTRDDFAHSALYALGGDSVSHVIDDWYLIDARGGPTLVNSRGDRRPVRNGEDVAVTELAGPPVYSNGLGYVDLAAATVHDLKPGGWDWQGAGDTWYWGALSRVPNSTVLQQAALWRNPDGSFEAEVLPIPPSDGGPGMLRAGTPGTMAVVEHFAQPRVAHISTDYGATWQVRRLPDDVDSGGELPSDWTTWPRP